MPETPKFYTPAIFNDQPLDPRSGDGQCFFQFDNYARTLARVIQSPQTHTPLTIGINGAWGTGKTTLMRRIRYYLDHTSNNKWPPDSRLVRTVWFNAWKYSRRESLFVALIREVLREMRLSDCVSRLEANLQQVFSPRVRIPEAMIDAVGQFLTGGRVKLDPTRFEVDSPFKINRAFLDEFMELFDQLVRFWVYRDWIQTDRDADVIDDRRGVLTIFVDDLDRCMPDTTVQVLESIKLLMDRPGLVFVLGASCDTVEKASWNGSCFHSRCSGHRHCAEKARLPRG